MRRLIYEKKVTTARTPVGEALRLGRGVCQDFAHLFLAACRGIGLPARYVSGYIHQPGEVATHAWCQVWTGKSGWLDIDPTRGTFAGDDYIKIAVGRDYSDVPPNRGVWKGRAEETISVSVKVEPIDRVPARLERLVRHPGPLVGVILGPVSIPARAREAQPASRLPPATRPAAAAAVMASTLEVSSSPAALAALTRGGGLCSMSLPAGYRHCADQEPLQSELITWSICLSAPGHVDWLFALARHPPEFWMPVPRPACAAVRSSLLEPENRSCPEC